MCFALLGHGNPNADVPVEWVSDRVGPSRAADTCLMPVAFFHVTFIAFNSTASIPDYNRTSF